MRTNSQTIMIKFRNVIKEIQMAEDAVHFMFIYLLVTFYLANRKRVSLE